MEQVKRMLYNLQKSLILSMKLNEATRDNIPSGYAYAWTKKVYPLFDEWADYHLPYNDQFMVKEEEIRVLFDFLCNKWDEKKRITFYELESRFGVHGSTRSDTNWNRGKLIHCCRYFFIYGTLDTAFWSGLLAEGHCPAEAHGLNREFSIDEITL